MFRSQQIIITDYVCTSLKLLNYFKNIEFKILTIIPGVVAAKRVLCAAPHGSPHIPVTRFATHNTGNDCQDFKFNVF